MSTLQIQGDSFYIWRLDLIISREFNMEVDLFFHVSKALIELQDVKKSIRLN